MLTTLVIIILIQLSLINTLSAVQHYIVIYEAGGWQIGSQVPSLTPSEGLLTFGFDKVVASPVPARTCD